MAGRVPFGEIVAMPLTEIDAADRLRPLDPAHVEGIAISIEQVGQQSPIILRPAGNRYRLVAGWHRLAAVGRLGRADVNAIVKNLTAEEARLVEIDENLRARSQIR